MKDVLEHPTYPSTIWQLKPDQQGKLSVAEDRGGPFNIAWEVHGHGDIKLVVSNIVSFYCEGDCGICQLGVMHKQHPVSAL